MTKIDVETEWIGRLALDDKLRFLARLSYDITIAGRNSYEVGSDGLTNPRQLRRVNEIQHRVTACLSQLFSGTYPEGFDPPIAQWVLGETDGELKHLLAWSWNEAKSRILLTGGGSA